MTTYTIKTIAERVVSCPPWYNEPPYTPSKILAQGLTLEEVHAYLVKNATDETMEYSLCVIDESDGSDAYDHLLTTDPYRYLHPADTTKELLID